MAEHPLTRLYHWIRPGRAEVNDLRDRLQELDTNQDRIVSLMTAMRDALTLLAIEGKVDASELEEEIQAVADTPMDLTRVIDRLNRVELAEAVEDTVLHEEIQETEQVLRQDLRDAVDGLSAEQEQLQQEIQDLSDRTDDIRDELQAEEQETTALEEQLVEVQDLSEQMETFIEESIGGNFEELQEIVVELEERTSVLEQEDVGALRAEVDEVMERLDTLSKDPERGEISSRLLDAESNIRKLQDQTGVIESQIEQLRTDLVELTELVMDMADTPEKNL